MPVFLQANLFSQSRASAPDCIAADWIAGEFGYYAILVDILRSRLKCTFSPLTHRECVSYSRKSLRALHHLQKNLADTPGFVDPYPSFLTWLVDLLPASPVSPLISLRLLQDCSSIPLKSVLRSLLQHHRRIRHG
jgi:hypothetical protein